MDQQRRFLRRRVQRERLSQPNALGRPDGSNPSAGRFASAEPAGARRPVGVVEVRLPPAIARPPERVSPLIDDLLSRSGRGEKQHETCDGEATTRCAAARRTSGRVRLIHVERLEERSASTGVLRVSRLKRLYLPRRLQSPKKSASKNSGQRRRRRWGERSRALCSTRGNGADAGHLKKWGGAKLGVFPVSCRADSNSNDAGHNRHGDNAGRLSLQDTQLSDSSYSS